MRAVTRILAIFESFSADRTSQSLQQIADRIDLPKSTTFRLVQSLDGAGYLVRLDNQAYCLSHRFARLAGLVDGTLGIRQIARPIMIELAGRSAEAVTLNTVNGRYRVCVDVIDTPSPLMSVTKPGTQVRLVDGATAKTLMAYMPALERQAAVKYAAKASGRKGHALTTELKHIAQQGYAVTYDERVLGLAAVAAPIRGGDDAVKYCLTITGPTVRVRPKEKEFVRWVVRAADDVSRRLGAGSRETGKKS